MPAHTTKTLASAALLAAVLIPGAARAQFAGDVFFEAPSQAASVGEEVSFDVVVFAGADPLGGASFDLVYDPSVLEFVSAGPGDEQPLAPSVTADAQPGRVSLVVVNGEKRSGPIGTVELARVTLRPIAGEGTRSTLSLSAEDLVTTEGVTFPRFRAFSGSVLVRSGLSTLSAAAAPRAAELEAMALEMRPAGSTVNIATEGGTVTVTTTDPAAQEGDAP